VVSAPSYRIEAGGTLSGTARVPGDKSISHRAVMLGAIAEGVTEITGFLEGEDCLSTLRAFRAMGVDIESAQPGTLRITGAGARGLQAPNGPLDLGNSGTSMRLMTGLLCAQPFACTLTGDASLSRRPMKRIIEPLARMGAKINSTDGHAPLRIEPVPELRAISYDSPVASAQVKSGILLAGLYASGTTEFREPEPSRDHTERMLEIFGVSLKTQPGCVSLAGGQRLRAAAVQVPADISSAAFFMVGAALVPGSELLLTEVGVNPTRTGIIDLLRDMGAHIELLNRRHLGAEPVADIRVRGGDLRGVKIGRAQVAAAIDEFPALFIAAACAHGVTEISGAEELRVKESDRIQVMCDGLTTLGIEAKARPDGAVIRGGRLGGGTVDSHGDHRVAMSFAMASLRATGSITVLDCANVNTSFPGFTALARGAGLQIVEV
jgi:3-phosphoshikimate 1-carboxyvinyltransferase